MLVRSGDDGVVVQTAAANEFGRFDVVSVEQEPMPLVLTLLI